MPNMNMARAVFLDRDGVINKYREGYVKTIDEFEILPHVDIYLKKIRKLGFKIIVLTNQSPVNRNLMRLDDLKMIHENLINRLRKNKCIIDDIFYCPHMPEVKCGCRKPAIGLFRQAQYKHDIRLNDSWMIGDSDTDIEAGRRAGCMTIKIKRDGTLKEAYKVIKKYEQNHN